jgi:hypothetical protein
MSLIQQWKDISTVLHAKICRVGQKANAKKLSQKFVYDWVTKLNRKAPHYFHLLHEHGDWIFNCMPESAEYRDIHREAVSWWTTQNLEAAHGLRKRAFARKTMHGKCLKYVFNDGRTHVVNEAPGVFQLFLWDWRITICNRVINRPNIDGVQLTLDTSDLKDLEWLTSEEVTELSNNEGFLEEKTMCDLFGYPKQSTIYLTGRGDVFTPVKLRVSLASQSAISKIRNAGGVVMTSQVIGKPPKIDRFHKVEQEKRFSNKRRRDAVKDAFDQLVDYV